MGFNGWAYINNLNDGDGGLCKRFVQPVNKIRSTMISQNS
jgi:hypothetical protein